MYICWWGIHCLSQGGSSGEAAKRVALVRCGITMLKWTSQHIHSGQSTDIGTQILDPGPKLRYIEFNDKACLQANNSLFYEKNKILDK